MTPKKPVGIIVLGILCGTALIGAIVALIIGLTSGGGTSQGTKMTDPRSVAQAFVDSSNRDSDGSRLICQADREAFAKFHAEHAAELSSIANEPSGPPMPHTDTMSVVDVNVAGDSGTFTIRLTTADGSHSDDQLDLVNEDGGWKVCGIAKALDPVMGP